MQAPKPAPESTDRPPFEAVYDLVRRIPKKKVATYGQISQLVQGRISALAVSWAMAAARASGHTKIPWHRVVHADGSLGKSKKHAKAQRALLEAEGIAFAAGALDLERHAWRAKAR